MNCPITGQITSSYDTFDIFIFCAPDQLGDGSSIAQDLGFSTVGQWAYDIQNGYPVLLIAVGVAIIMTFIYICLLRCCTGVLLWVSIVLLILGFIAVGVLIFL